MKLYPNFKNHRQKIKAYRAGGKMFGQTFNPRGLTDKEPWKMSELEFRDGLRCDVHGVLNATNYRNRMIKRLGNSYHQYAGTMGLHEMFVRKAIAEGRHVPPEIRAGYSL